MATIDISKFLDSKTPIHVDVEAWDNLLSEKNVLPNSTIHIGNSFVSLKNENGEHLLSIGINF
jgi:hypothetical protein